MRRSRPSWTRSTSAARAIARCSASSRDRHRSLGRIASSPTIAACSSRSRACAATAITALVPERSSARCVRRSATSSSSSHATSSSRTARTSPSRCAISTGCARCSRRAARASSSWCSPARLDAQALVEITRGREIGVPTFVIGGLLDSCRPLGLAPRERHRSRVVDRAPRRRDRGSYRARSSRGSSCVAQRSRAGASDSRLRSRSPSCGGASEAAAAPPRDQSRRFAVVAISLTLGVWIVLPLLVTLSLAR